MIDLIDPSALAKGASEGPQTWGEAFSRAVGTSDDVMTVIENTNADSDALERAYDLRIAAIRDLTGTQLPNPLRVASGVDREMIDIFAMQAGGGGTVLPSQISPDFRRRQEEEFNERARALSDRFPQIEAIISKPVIEERNQVVRDAKTAADLANQSPELGTIGRFAAGLVGGLKGAARDPQQWGMAFLGAGGGTAKTVAGRIGQTILTEGLINGGQELVLQGLSQERKREAGIEHGMGDMLANVGIAATFGALFGGTVQGGAELARVFKLGEGGEAIAARVIEGRPEPGDVEVMAKVMNIELGPERLDLISRSFEERVLDDVTVRADASPAEIRVFEAAQRYADDPDNNPPPELIERLLADEEAARTRFSPDEYERMFAGDQNAIDDIADTFMAGAVDDAVRRIDAVADRVDAIAERVDDISDRPSAASTPTASWVIRERANGRVILETFDRRKVDALNTEKYEAIPVQQHLAEVNRSASGSAEAVRQEGGSARPGTREVVAGDQRAPANDRASLDPIEGQTIRPRQTPEPLDNAAETIADVQAGEIVEPARDANGNPENYLDFIAIDTGGEKPEIMSVSEALALADEPEFFADLMEACKL
ncbi:hypothetical protein PWG15_05465 [Ensifer adhaerens]|uniref:hypothetical protein n=1 Tax=Ensifer adhaerens TaxID=106592 RepID=UPI0023A9B257|nr:hypothetical protein [Ensifer adhaerens]WDZ77953.1 hypothetical protein PWG15_05465 [Ensifer adhaerens]